MNKFSTLIKSPCDVFLIDKFFRFRFQIFLEFLNSSRNLSHKSIKFVFQVILRSSFHLQTNLNPFSSIFKIFLQEKDFLFFTPVCDFGEIVVKSYVIDIPVSVLLSSFKIFFLTLIHNGCNFFPTGDSSLFFKFPKQILFLR